MRDSFLSVFDPSIICFSYNPEFSSLFAPSHHVAVCCVCSSCRQTGTEKSSWKPGWRTPRNAANAQGFRCPTRLRVATTPGTRCPHPGRLAPPAPPSPPQTRLALCLLMTSLLWWDTRFQNKTQTLGFFRPLFQTLFVVGWCLLL